MKRWIALLLCAVCLFSGCKAAGDTPGEVTTEVPTTQMEETTIPPTAETEFVPPMEPTMPPAPELPEEMVYDLCEFLLKQTGSVRITMQYETGEILGPQTRYLLPTCLTHLGEAFTPVEDPDISTRTHWVRITTGDDKSGVTIYGGDPVIILYDREGTLTAYRLEDSAGSIQNIMTTLSASEAVLLGRQGFPCEGGPEEVLARYVSYEHFARNQRLTEGNTLRYKRYIPIEWTVTDQRENAFRATVTYAVEFEIQSPYAQGQGMEGTGEYAGCRILTEQLAFEKGNGDIWYVIGDRDYHTARTEYTREAETDDPVGQWYLETVPQRIRWAMEATGEEQIYRLAQIFLTSTTAASMSSRTQFDWTLLCTEEAINSIGIQSLMNQMVRPGAGGMCGGIIFGYVPIEGVVVHEDWAVSFHYEIRIFYEKDSQGNWKVCAVERPFAGT